MFWCMMYKKYEYLNRKRYTCEINVIKQHFVDSKMGYVACLQNTISMLPKYTK